MLRLLLILLIVLIAFSVCGGLALAEPVPAVTWLLVPVKDLSGEAPAGLQQAVTDALEAKLRAVGGWSVILNDPNADVVIAAMANGLITQAEATTAPDLASARKLGLIRKADAVLLGLLVKQEESFLLNLTVVGVLGRQTAGPGKKIAILPLQADMGRGISPEDLAKALTADVGDRLLAVVSANAGLWKADAQAGAEWEAEGDKYWAAEEYQQARLAYEAAVASDPTSVVYHRKLAQTLLALKQAAQAQKQLEIALGLAPKDVESLLALGDVYLALDNPGRASAQFQSAALLAKNDIRPGVGNARTYLARGDAARAVKAYEELFRQAPHDAALHSAYAQALAQIDRDAQAAREFRLALQLAPEDRAARLAFAEHLFKQRKVADGLAQLRQVSDESKEPMTYPAAKYQQFMRYFIQEFKDVQGALEPLVTGYWNDDITLNDFQRAMQDMHARSDNLARLGERIIPPKEFDGSHKYWVLAANLLNQSDFEALRYANNEGLEHEHSAELFRKSSATAEIQARELTPRQ